MTPSEKQVAALAAQGMSNAAIAAVRGTSSRTVANQIARVLAELGVPSRRSLAVLTELAPRETERSRPCWRALSERQLTIVARASDGTPQKVIAIELGLPAATVSESLRQSRHVLGLATFADLARAYRAA